MQRSCSILASSDFAVSGFTGISSKHLANSQVLSKRGAPSRLAQKEIPTAHEKELSSHSLDRILSP